MVSSNIIHMMSEEMSQVSGDMEWLLVEGGHMKYRNIVEAG